MVKLWKFWKKWSIVLNKFYFTCSPCLCYDNWSHNSDTFTSPSTSYTFLSSGLAFEFAEMLIVKSTWWSLLLTDVLGFWCGSISDFKKVPKYQSRQRSFESHHSCHPSDFIPWPHSKFYFENATLKKLALFLFWGNKDATWAYVKI
jgi:hypothetical protein